MSHILNSKKSVGYPFSHFINTLMIHWPSFARDFQTELDITMCLLRRFGIPLRQMTTQVAKCLKARPC